MRILMKCAPHTYEEHQHTNHPIIPNYRLIPLCRSLFVNCYVLSPLFFCVGFTDHCFWADSAIGTRRLMLCIDQSVPERLWAESSTVAKRTNVEMLL